MIFVPNSIRWEVSIQRFIERFYGICLGLLTLFGCLLLKLVLKLGLIQRKSMLAIRSNEGIVTKGRGLLYDFSQRLIKHLWIWICLLISLAVVDVGVRELDLLLAWDCSESIRLGVVSLDAIMA